MIKPLNQTTFSKRIERAVPQADNENFLEEKMECENAVQKSYEVMKNNSFSKKGPEMMNPYANSSKDQDNLFSELRNSSITLNLNNEMGKKDYLGIRQSYKKKTIQEGCSVPQKVHLKEYNTFQKNVTMQQNMIVFTENQPKASILKKETPKLANLDTNQNLNNEQSKTLNDSDQKPNQNFSKTKDLLASFHQNINEIPQKTQDKLNNVQKPDLWNIGIDETVEFFGKLASTSMDPDEYLTQEDYNIQPQEIDLPHDIMEGFQKKIENSAARLYQNLRDVNDLFVFCQKVGRLFGDKTNQTIQQSKEISGAFSSLSNYIWDYIQKKFDFTDNDVSQEFSLSFQDVAEKITSQNFFSEVNSSPELGTLLNFFQNIMFGEHYTDFLEDLKKYFNEMLVYDILDYDLKNHLFGEDFEFSNEISPIANNQEQEELKNQYMTISQDLAQFSNNKTEESRYHHDLQQNQIIQESQTQSHKSQKVQEEKKLDLPQKNLQKDVLESNRQRSTQINAQTTQVTATRTSMTNQSEYNIFQHSIIDFGDGFTPIGFEDDNNFMASFPFSLEDQFKIGDSIETENSS